MPFTDWFSLTQASFLLLKRSVLCVSSNVAVCFAADFGLVSFSLLFSAWQDPPCGWEKGSLYLHRTLSAEQLGTRYRHSIEKYIAAEKRREKDTRPKSAARIPQGLLKTLLECPVHTPMTIASAFQAVDSPRIPNVPFTHDSCKWKSEEDNLSEQELTPWCISPLSAPQRNSSPHPFSHTDFSHRFRAAGTLP